MLNATAANLVMHYGPLQQLSDVLWATAMSLVMCYWSLQRTWLCAMGHYGGFGMLYGPLRRMKRYSENLWQFLCCPGFGYALWSKGQDLVMRYGPQLRIVLYAVGHSAGICFAVWAIAQDLVMHHCSGLVSQFCDVVLVRAHLAQENPRGSGFWNGEGMGRG